MFRVALPGSCTKRTKNKEKRATTKEHMCHFLVNLWHLWPSVSRISVTYTGFFTPRTHNQAYHLFPPFLSFSHTNNTKNKERKIKKKEQQRATTHMSLSSKSVTDICDTECYVLVLRIRVFLHHTHTTSHITYFHRFKVFPTQTIQSIFLKKVLHPVK